MQELESYYAGVVQEDCSDGEDSLLPCLQKPVTKIQCLIQRLGIDHLWEIRLGGYVEDLIEVLVHLPPFPDIR